MKPSVTAILLCYNHEKFILEALISIFNQDYENYQIVIRDDKSTDDSPNIIAQFLHDFENVKHEPKIKYIKGESNLGLIGSYNSALSFATGEIIVGFAGDDISELNRISKTINYLIRYQVDLVALDSIVIDINGGVLSNSFYKRNNNDALKGIGEKIGNKRLITFENASRFNISAGGYGFTYRRKLLDFNNGFFPLDVSYEDSFLMFLSLCNNGVIFSYEPLVRYRMHETNVSHSGLNMFDKLNSLLGFKKLDLTFIENKIRYLKISNIQNSIKINEINRLKKRIAIINIHIFYLKYKYPILNIRKLLWPLFINNEVSYKTFIKCLMFVLFPFKLKKVLKKEFENRSNYYSFN